MRNHRSSTASDRRRAPRFEIASPAVVDGVSGQTRDLSSSGIYVTLPKELASQIVRGGAVRLEVQFQHANRGGPLTVACEGRVVRVEPHESHVGVAASITSYGFGWPGEPGAPRTT